MGELNTRTLGEICDEGAGTIRTGPFGSQLHQSDYSDEGTPVVMPKDILEGKVEPSDVARVGDQHVARLVQHCLELGDIVYGRRGDIGRHAFIREEERGWLCGTGCLRISLGNADLDPKYLHYYLDQEHVIGWIRNQAIGATMPNLNTSILRSVPISYPDLETQRRIASILGAYDDLIENNLRRIRILEEMAQRLYREWFVHFRFPGHEKHGPRPESNEAIPARGNSPSPRGRGGGEGAVLGRGGGEGAVLGRGGGEGAVLGRGGGEGAVLGRGGGEGAVLGRGIAEGAWIPSELGPIPEGWEVKKLGELAAVNEKSIKKGDAPVEINYIDIKSVSPGRIEEIAPMSFDEAPGRARRIVRHGDMIWSCVRPNRRSHALILNPQENLICSTGFAVLTPKTIPFTFLYHAVTTDEFVGYLTNHATGAAYPAVNAQDFKNAEVLVPGSGLLNGFHETVKPMFLLISTLVSKNVQLRNSRDLLLPKLISGQAVVCRSANNA